MILVLQLVRTDMNKQLRNKQQKCHLSHKNKVLQELRVRTDCSFSKSVELNSYLS